MESLPHASGVGVGEVFFYLLFVMVFGFFDVVGPHQPIVALVDDDVILPCHVEPAEDVTAEILEWTRSDLNPRFVHVWRSGQDLVNTRNPSYRGRSSLFINELKRGNISLKLSREKLSDKGTYECHIPMMGKNYFVKLVVEMFIYFELLSLLISLSGSGENRGGVVLQCESAGWYPEPELLWLDGEGNLLSAGPTETLRGPDNLYTVSSRVTFQAETDSKIIDQLQEAKDTAENLKTQMESKNWESRLIGPNQPIIATAEEDITLPCHLVPGENVAVMTLEWARPDLDPRFVLVCRAGQELIYRKNPSYIGRSSLFTDELKHGNISLKLSKVKPADQGRYRCYIPEKDEEVFIDLVVGAVSSPVISLANLDKAISGVVLQCESAGWYPEPELLWLDGEGNLLSVNLVYKMYDMLDFGLNEQESFKITCNSVFIVSDEYFQLNSSSAAPIIIGVVVSLALSIILILIVVFFIWRRNKTSKTQINLPSCQNYYLKFCLQGLKQHTCKVINLFVLH
uniref:Ig-like domain-containing protein n=1 Tax=Maylandia zebra TaxID=106582 RepID=A0A3P9AV20_9CICH